MLLPHTLEFEADPQAVVREADRVLTGEGQLIILGFRPVQPVGLASGGLARGISRRACSSMLGARRVRDWLGLLGYEVVLAAHLPLQPPWGAGVARPRRILRRGLFNPLPARRWLIKARKHVYRMTPLRHRFSRERRRALGRLPEPTTRNRTMTGRRDLYGRGLPRQSRVRAAGARC